MKLIISVKSQRSFEKYYIFIDGLFALKARGNKEVELETSNMSHILELKSLKGKSSLIKITPDEREVLYIDFITHFSKELKKDYFELVSNDSRVEIIETEDENIMKYKNKNTVFGIIIKKTIIISTAFILSFACLFWVIQSGNKSLKLNEKTDKVPDKINNNQNTTSKETLYLVKIDDYDFWAEEIKTYNQEYTGQISGQNVAVKEFITISENNKCYYSDQIKFNNGAITTIQGNCTYSKNDNKLAVDGVYNRLDVPSTIEQNHGVSSTNSKEEAHLDFEIGSNGKYMKAKNITYYNSFYVMMSERKSEYILVDKNNESYDLNGKSIRKIYNKVTDESEYVTLDLNQYNIIEK